MSVTVINQSIKYGETAIITVDDLYNVVFNENNTIISVEQTGTSTFVATVQPLSSTIYYYYGYNSSQTQINQNVTVYVNVTAVNSTVVTDFNTPIQLNVIGVKEYTWGPSIFLNNTSSSSVLCTPLENITYKILGLDSFLTTSYTSINVIVNTKMVFTPPNPTVYDGNLLIVKVNYNNQENIKYIWKTIIGNFKQGDTIRLNPYNTFTYIVDAYNNNQLVSSDKVNITVIQKPSNIIDVDILPYSLFSTIMSRNKKKLISELLKNKKLSKKIIDFYYTTLQTAYKMEWTNKNGISYKVNWNTVYQNINETNGMIISFTQQWNFFQYIYYNKNSNFAFLLTTVNEIYLETPQKIYITPLQLNSF